ncbi:MAG: superfamily hydrolase [Candidatus Saccharibacteria bacterium]|nr:superfamily hydrolase [Candidatus Saccharibacteria bacterium]
MAMDEKGLGKRLQEVRRSAGLTQQELCHAANLSFSTLAKIERGAIRSPSIFTIQSIAGALKMSLDDLLGIGSSSRSYGKSKSGLTFVYFDVNGCLVRFYQRASARVAEDHGLAPEQVEMAYLHFNDEVCRGTMTLDDFNAAVAGRLGIESLDWASYYLEAAEPLLDMHQTLAWVAEHYRIGLLTNIMPGMLDELLKLGKIPTLPYDVIVDSSVIGMIKPESQIYSYAVEQAGVPVDEILFVDDTQTNLVAAEKHGLRVVWFDYARPEESAANVRKALELAD